jgi:RNA recognition motif-containing protein
MQIYVGNLPESFTDDDLKALFEPFGRVVAASIGKEKGYGFVEMQKKSEARAATDALRGKDMNGKPLRAKVLKPGDEFQSHAESLHGAAKVAGGGKNMRTGGSNFRGTGAIRRGGQRGS